MIKHNEIKILIADDHQMFIDGIKSLLRKEQHLNFVGEVHDGKKALKFLKNSTVDLLITDISMPEMSGVDLAKEVKKLYPDIKILVLTMYNDKEIISEILLSEAEGYVLKNTGKKELLRAIEYIVNGSTYYSNEVLSIMTQKVKKQSMVDKETATLTPREFEIIKLIVQEYTTADIGKKLFISPRTVETHRKNIMLKTGSKTIVGLIKFAFRNDLII